MQINNPSDVQNVINGFNVVPCSSFPRMTLYLVFPNIGYGLLANLYARNDTRKGSTVIANPGFAYDIRESQSDSDRNITEHVTGEELFVPLNGMDISMYVTHGEVNSECAKDQVLSNDISLPVPIRVITTDMPEYVETIKTNTSARSRNYLMFDCVYQIAYGCVETDVVSVVEKGIAAEIFRAIDTLDDGTSQWKWTGTGSDKRAEYLTLYNKQTIPYKDHISRGISGVTVDQVFVRPSALLLVDHGSGKRVVYSQALQNSIARSIEISGAQYPPTVTIIRGMYLIDASSVPTWSGVSAKPVSEVANALGIPQSLVDSIASTYSGSSSILGAELVPKISGLKRQEQNEEGEYETVELDATLVTIRPPLFTAGEFIASHNAIGDVYALPFNKFYFWPYGTASRNGTLLCKGIFGKEEIDYITAIPPENAAALIYNTEGFAHLASAMGYYWDVLSAAEPSLRMIATEVVLSSEFPQHTIRGSRLCPKQSVQDFPLQPVHNHDSVLAAPDTVYLSRITDTYTSHMLISPLMKLTQAAPPPSAQDMTFSEMISGLLGDVPIGNSQPYNIVEPGTIAHDDYFPFVMYEQATKISPPENTQTSKADRGTVVRPSESTIPHTPEMQGSVSDDGYISVASLFASPTGMGKRDAAKSVCTLMEVMPAVLAKAEALCQNTAVTVTDTAVANPVPLTAEGTVSAGMSFERIATTLRSIAYLFSENTENADTHVPEWTAMFGTFHKMIWNAFRAVKQYSEGESVDIAMPAADIEPGLRFALMHLTSAQGSIIQVSGSSTFLYAETADAMPVSIEIPEASYGKGLWFYNLRKMYMLWISTINLCIALIERMISYLGTLSYSISTIPCEPEEITSNLDIALFAHGTSPVYPVCENEITIADLPSTRINSITQFFPEGSLYYNMEFKIEEVLESQDTCKPVFFPGFGGGTSSPFHDEYPHFWSTKYEKFSEAVSVNGALDQTFADLQAMLSPHDFFVYDNSAYSYQNGESIESADGATFISLLTQGNSVSQPNIVGATFKGKVDTTKIFPYISTLYREYGLNLELDLEYKTAYPKNIELVKSYSFADADASLWLTDKESAIRKVDNAITSLMAYVQKQEAINALAAGASLSIPVIGSTDPALWPGKGDSSLHAYMFKEMGASMTAGLEATIKSQIESSDWFTDTAPSSKFNYNLFLSKRRAHVSTCLFINRLIKRFANGPVKIGNTNYYMYVGFSVPAGYSLVSESMPFTPYGFGSLFISSGTHGIDWEPMFQHQRSMRMSIQHYSDGEPARPFRVTSDVFDFQFPVSGSDGVLVSANSPYVPQYESTDAVWHTRVNKNNVPNDAEITAYYTTVMNALSPQLFRPVTGILARVKAFAANADARANVKTNIETFINSNLASFAYRPEGSIFATTKIIIVQKQ